MARPTDRQAISRPSSQSPGSDPVSPSDVIAASSGCFRAKPLRDWSLAAVLPTRRVLRVGSACAGSVTRVPRRSLVMGGLNDAVDRTLVRVEIIQPVVGADRVGVCGRPGTVARTGKSHAWSARRPLNLTSGSGTRTETRNSDCARRSREEGLRPHIAPSFSEQLLLPTDLPYLGGHRASTVG
jgi:hypothetical protein